MAKTKQVNVMKSRFEITISSIFNCLTSRQITFFESSDKTDNINIILEDNFESYNLAFLPELGLTFSQM